jgi:hypothetical protein
MYTELDQQETGNDWIRIRNHTVNTVYTELYLGIFHLKELYLMRQYLFRDNSVRCLFECLIKH